MFQFFLAGLQNLIVVFDHSGRFGNVNIFDSFEFLRRIMCVSPSYPVKQVPSYF